MKNRNITFSAILIAGLILTLPLQAADLPRTALGNAGELFTLKSGTPQDFFPGDESQDAEHPLLAIEIAIPGEEPQLLTVPTTEGVGIEQDGWIVYDKYAGLLNVIWQETTAGVNRVLLSHLDADGWGDVYEVYVGQPDSAPPSMAWTRDSFAIALGDTGETIPADRQILHLVWRGHIENPDGISYSPVIFVEGRYVGWQEVFDLSALWADSRQTAKEAPPVVPAGLENALSLEIAEDQKSVHIAFADAETSTVAVCDISILPLELAYLSNYIRKQVLVQAADFDPQDLTSFADNMRIEIIGMGARFGFHSTVVNYVAENVGSRIEQDGSQYTAEDLPTFADELHAYSIDMIASLLGVEATTSDDGQVIEIDIGGLLGDPTEAPGQLLDLRIASEMPAPTAMGDLPAVIYPATNGRGMLVAWQDAEAGQLLYVESGADGWSEVRKVSMEGLTVDEVDRLLRQRVR